MKKNNGIILVNKETGYTSRDVVNILSKKLNTKKVGHTGTLDPLASGVLVICFGKYTKLVNLLTSTKKEYIAEIKLGIMTDTLDITGNILKQKPFKVTKEDIIKVLNSFKGIYHMEVPIYSAVKVKGKKLYEYARENMTVKLPQKDVTIYDIKLLDYHDDLIKFQVEVEKGTYIRSLIKDICIKLNTLGTMNNLMRIKQGNFRIENTYTLKDIQDDNYQILDLKDVLNIKEYYLIDTPILKKIMNGNKITLPNNEPYLIFTFKNQEIALYEKKGKEYQPLIMF